MRSLVKLAGLSAIAVALVAGGPARAEYPERPITIIVPWGAGGGTDATGRILASMLEQELGVPVSVVNRTGGSGVVGHSAIATAAPDGYTLGVVTVEIGMMHWQGLTELTYEDYTPLALYNADPAGLQVRVDSEWDSAQAVLDAIKAEPGAYKSSGTGQGGIWHLALAGMLQEAGIPPDAAPWVPSQGAAPGLQDLVAGGVDIVTCSVPEAQALLEAGRVKSLAVMSEERNPTFPDVPTLKEATGLDWTVAAWRGIAGPKGMPQEVSDKLVPLLRQIWDSQEFKDFMAQRGFGLVWGDPEEFHAWMAESDESLGAVMKAVGLAN
ncbi:MAG: transporter substrate-binding protein [Burkholderiales bacterium]|jgi:tripartite-type tricarboxylate transporter receptor subunit TctC|nr:transporter substrate-binding protein [Burkholderiales bacterium]